MQTQCPLGHTIVWDKCIHLYKTQICEEGKRCEGMQKAELILGGNQQFQDIRMKVDKLRNRFKYII